MNDFQILGKNFSEFVGGNRKSYNKEKYGGKKSKRRRLRGGTRKRRSSRSRSRR